MTKRIYFLVLVLTIINSALYAFSNPYFSASERGWSVERESDENLTFEINSYTPSEEEEEFLPKINILIKKADANTYNLVKYDQKELDQLKEAVKNGAFKDYLEASRKGFMTTLEKKYPHITRKQREEGFNEFFGNSEVSSSYYGKIGKNKAHIVEYNIGPTNIRRYFVFTLDFTIILEFMWNNKTDLVSLDAYKSFMNSFASKGKEPTSFNASMNYGLGRQIVRLIVLLLVAGAVTVVKKLKGNY